MVCFGRVGERWAMSFSTRNITKQLDVSAPKSSKFGARIHNGERLGASDHFHVSVKCKRGEEKLKVRKLKDATESQQYRRKVAPGQKIGPEGKKS